MPRRRPNCSGPTTGECSVRHGQIWRWKCEASPQNVFARTSPLRRPGVASAQREGYAAALTGLWKRLAWALTELESIAADPLELFDEDSVLERLPSLQYALHAASELALGLRPPAGAEIAHAELAAALPGARDATAEIAEVEVEAAPALAGHELELDLLALGQSDQRARAGA